MLNNQQDFIFPLFSVPLSLLSCSVASDRCVCLQLHSGKQSPGTQYFVGQNIIAFNFLNGTLNNLKYIIVIGWGWVIIYFIKSKIQIGTLRKALDKMDWFASSVLLIKVFWGVKYRKTCKIISKKAKICKVTSFN